MSDSFVQESMLAGRISEEIVDQLWNNGYGNVRPFGFKPEDPTLTGGSEDVDGGSSVVLVSADGDRFAVEVAVYVTKLPALEDDPDYIEAQRVKFADSEPVMDPNQGVLFNE